MAEHTQNQFVVILKLFVCTMFILVLVDGFLVGFSKFWFFIVENRIVSYTASTLKWFSSLTELTLNEFSRMLSQRLNFNSVYICKRIHVHFTSIHAAPAVLEEKYWNKRRATDFLVAIATLKQMPHFCALKGTQEWEFFWLRFWNLYFFVDS